MVSRQRIGQNGLGYLSRHEITRLFRLVKQRDFVFYNFIYITYLHGLRVSETLNLKKSDYNIQEKKVVINRLKGSHQTIQSANEIELSFVRISKKNQLFEFSRATADRKFKLYCRQIGIDHNRSYIHILKHSAAVHLMQSGADIYTIKKTLGHRDIKSTMVYLKYVDKNIDNALLMLSEGLKNRGLV